MSSKVCVATSIAPFNIPHQQSAIATWVRLGFRVVSLNVDDEIRLLRPVFPDVHFSEVTRNGAAIAGRPFVYFDDVLAALDREGYPVCGIINSDIHLNALEDFASFVAHEAIASFVFGSRIEVQTLDALEGEENCWGFDLFFFDRNLTNVYPPSEFCLGVPWWDYWAPLVPTLRGLPVKHLVSDIGIHLTHNLNWSMELYECFGRKCLSYLAEQDPHYSRLAQSESSLQDALVLIVYTLAQAQKCHYPVRPALLELEQGDELVKLSKTRELLRFVEKMQELMTPPPELRRLRLEMEKIEKSVSWRVTRPLRWLKERLEPS